MSIQDKGGRNAARYPSSSGAGASGSGSRTAQASTSRKPSSPEAATSIPTIDYAPPSYSSGYVPARTPPPRTQTPVVSAATTNTTTTIITQPTTVAPQASAIPATSDSAAFSPTEGKNAAIVTRVRALHTFEPTEVGELAFEKGDIIKVVDRVYKDWWRGQLKGRTGIFPVNYVVFYILSTREIEHIITPILGTDARAHCSRACERSGKGGCRIFTGRKRRPPPFYAPCAGSGER